MHNKKDILKSLNEFNYFIDEQVLSSFIKNWKIDSIYEDEDGVEFFDNLSIAKIKKGISLKSQGYDNEQIAFHVQKIIPEKPQKEVAKKVVNEIPNAVTAISSPIGLQQADLKNITVDVTSQTLQLLADTIAQKISAEIKGQIQTSGLLLEDSSLKSDNEMLSKQVNTLLDDNKKLAKRVEELEKKKKGLFGLFR